MASEFFDSPPLLSGSEKEQLQTTWRYLNAMSEKLNLALTNIGMEQLVPETRILIESAGEANTAITDQAAALKSMIIKTAEIVRHEMDEISTHLEDNYEALSSQFGTYERNLTSNITATAEGILQEYGYSEKITALENETESFQRKFEQYIFTGLVDETNGRYGIAIGENVTAYDSQGNAFINPDRKMATFTMDELAFYQGDVKLAWFTNNVMHIANSEVTQTMTMGNHIWKILTGGAIALISGTSSAS
jgi:hypothetical protein